MAIPPCLWIKEEAGIPIKGSVDKEAYDTILPEGVRVVSVNTIMHNVKSAKNTPESLTLRYEKNTLCGRSGFLIHGDSTRHPGEASNGCIIVGPKHRKAIWESNDKEVVVI